MIVIMIIIILIYLELVGGFKPSENMKLSWDDYSQYMESHKSHVPNHQPVIYYDIFIFNHEPDHSDDDDDADPSGPQTLQL
jgi:hypothetical protein